MKKSAFGIDPSLPVPPELLATVGGLYAGHGTGKSLAGQTAASLAAKGKKLRTEEKARRAAIFAGPLAGVAALALARKYGLGPRAAELMSKKFPSGLIAHPELESQAVRLATPFVTGLGGAAAGGLATGAVAGGLSHLGKGKEKSAMSLREFIKEARDMPPFLSQDRPKKVKEIYRALKRDHPGMPAELKARIAARQGKRGKQKQGPPYKGPIKKEAASRLSQTLGAIGRKVPDWAIPAAAGVGAGVGTGAGVLLAVGPKGRERMAKEIRDPRLYSNLRGLATLESRKEKVEAHKKLPKSKGSMLHAMKSGFTRSGKGKKAAVMTALTKRAADLRIDIVNRASHCGESMEKSAAEQYFHELRKPTVDQEMLGQKFCKLAHGIGRDPWELALEVADNFPAYAVLSKTASDPKARELANFYLDWSDEMEKTAFLGKVLGAGKALGQRMGRLTSAGKMRQAVKAEQAAAPAGLSRRDIYAAYAAKGGKKVPTTGQAAKGGTNWGNVAIGAGALGATGAGGLWAYNKLKGQPQPAAAYGY